MNLSTKNISPRRLSFYTAIALSLPFSLLILIITNSILWVIISFIIMLLCSYLLISWMLEQFIYRKIKLIYKFIYQKKASRKEETYYKYLLPQKSIDEVGQEVEAWAEENKKEIELLRSNEIFRKEFLQNLSHELKTPIFAIQGYVEALLHGAIQNPELNQKFLTNAAKNIERLTNLAKDVDEISKLERGEQAILKNSFVIQDVVIEVFESLSVHAGSKNIHCSIKKGCETPLIVYADKEKIRQVLVNLVENSIKYGKQNGTVIASMYQTDGNNILVEITDDGIGINQKHLNRIFERFYRTDEGRRADVTGSGLGLAISKHIIEAHGQHIHVRSTEGVGTTIGFTLGSLQEI